VIVDIGTGIEQGFVYFEDYGTDSDDDHIPGSSDSLADPEDYDGDYYDFEDELEEANEISIEGDLLRFSAILIEAQSIAVKLEKESDAPKHPK
jgi:hypothetical protein